jgi:hypothetical protein
MWVEGSDPQITFDRQVIIMAKESTLDLSEAYYGCDDPLLYPLFFPRETGWNRWMPRHVPSYVVPPFIVQENNEDGTKGEDLQVPYRTSNAHVEQKR